MSPTMPKNNRRQHKRLKIHHSVSVPVHLFPVIPFIGHPVRAQSVNISSGGMAIKINLPVEGSKLKKGKKIKIHFRLPGHPIEECHGLIRHQFSLENEAVSVGIRFTKISKKLQAELARMAEDNEMCDTRTKEQPNPWCLPTCAYFGLCRKPIKIPDNELLSTNHLEIAFQSIL